MQELSPTGFRFALERGVAKITLSRPARLNSLTFEIYQELADFFVKLSQHEQVRAVVVTGEGSRLLLGRRRARHHRRALRARRQGHAGLHPRDR
jgi:enoyl-CoA hydratase/carnithine racemase